MSDFINFLEKLAQHCSIKFDAEMFRDEDEYELAANVLNEINRFLYQKKATLPSEYISEFHKYWEENHEKILSPNINPNGECLAVAKVLEGIYKNNTIKVQLDTIDLNKEEIANVRFFTAIQDFNIDLQAKVNPFEFYRNNPDCFNPSKILQNDLLIDTFLSKIGADAQRDKRKPWMKESAKLLLEKYAASAYKINDFHNADVLEIKKALVKEQKCGFSEKKTDMLLRDMVDMGVWKYCKNIDKINVMSDKNTMRVSLRTGILQFRIPLLTSYLDVYCKQYELVDRYNQLAWREVWNVWDTIENNHRPQTPASIDYFIFRMGKLACKKSTRRCPPSKPYPLKRLESLVLQDRLIFDKDFYCVFSSICEQDRKILNAPNSISIEGRTGWKSGKTNEGGGGGISS
ncbi:MAG: hypothetical protein COS84_04340 [Armatimonadetes bacterium CG07_land_8_20_14_0_80_40_9]|nr:MAG: hypothetical protein COS84_04340 [Armatimonadetes bacterium CG07_land_8_20_14_0_80_40_9]